MAGTKRLIISKGCQRPRRVVSNRPALLSTFWCSCCSDCKGRLHLPSSWSTACSVINKCHQCFWMAIKQQIKTDFFDLLHWLRYGSTLAASTIVKPSVYGLQKIELRTRRTQSGRILLMPITLAALCLTNLITVSIAASRMVSSPNRQ